MKYLKISSTRFQLPIHVVSFLSDYLKRLKSYVKDNSIDPELYEDILQGLAERISLHLEQYAELSQKEAIAIINALWEPEDIFPEEERGELEQVSTPKKAKDPRRFYEKLQDTWWARPKEGAIFFGVTRMLGNQTFVTTWVWRALLLFCFCFPLYLLLFAFPLYLLAGMLFPRKEKDYEQRGIFAYFMTQFWDLRLGVPYFLTALFHFFSFLYRLLSSLFTPMKTFFSSLFSGISSLFSWIWKLIQAGAFWLWVSFLVFILLASVVFLAGYAQFWVFGNIDYATLIPDYAWWGFAGGVFGALMLLAQAFLDKKKKLINVSLLVLAMGGILMAVYALTRLAFVAMMMDRGVDTKMNVTKFSYDFPLKEGQNNLIFDFDLAFLNNNSSSPYFPNYLYSFSHIHPSFSFLPHDEQEIKLEVEYGFEGINGIHTEEHLALIQKHLNPLNLSFEDNEFRLLYTKNKLFSVPVPFFDISLYYTFYLPRDLHFTFSDKTSSIRNNLIREPLISRYGGRGYSSCDDVYFKEEEGLFFCQKDLSKASMYREYAQYFLRDVRNELSPLQKNWGDWKVHSYDWKDNNHVTIKLQDNWFAFFVDVHLALVDGSFKIEESTLVDVEQRWMMNAERMEEYSGREALSWFTLNIEKTPVFSDEYNEENNLEDSPYVKKEELKELLKEVLQEEMGLLKKEALVEGVAVEVLSGDWLPSDE